MGGLTLGPAVGASTALDHVAAQPRFALVIGNADYRSVGKLRNPLNDAHDMCQQLRGLGFTTSCLYDIATRVELRSEIQDFVGSLPANAVGLFYYAGHAIQVNGENYLLGVNATPQADTTLVSEKVDLSYLLRELRRAQNYLNLVILDACRNDPVTPGTALPSQGLADINDAPAGTMIFYATGANSMASDGGTGRNGVLTKNLLAHLDAEGTLQDLFNEVSAGVQRDTVASGRLQVPALHSTFNETFCLVQCTQLEQQIQRVHDLQQQAKDGKQVADELAAENKKLVKLQEQDRKRREAVQRMNLPQPVP